MLGSSSLWRRCGLNQAQGFGRPGASLQLRVPAEPGPHTPSKMCLRARAKQPVKLSGSRHPTPSRFLRQFSEVCPSALPQQRVLSAFLRPGPKAVVCGPCVRVSAALLSFLFGPEPGKGSRGVIRT